MEKPKEIEKPKEKQEVKPEVLDFILESSKEVGPEMKKWYKDFHENPELGGEEVETAEKVKKHLEGLGIEIIDEGVGGSGIIARIKGKEGPAVALRADMDALPIQESEKNSPRSKKEGVMHGCGHDAHTAGLMGAAEILKKLSERDELDGDVILLFQPSEEKTHQKESGAVQMVKSLEKNELRDKIGAFLGLHVTRALERGWIRVKEGVQMASSGEVDIRLKAAGGHIMNAYEEPNLHLVFSELTTRLSKIFRPLHGKKEALIASAETKYKNAGYNVLPSEAESTWVVRIASELYRDISKDVIGQMKGVVEDMVKKHLKKGQKIDIEIERRPGYRPVIHRSPELVDSAVKSARGVMPGCQRSKELLLGGEDFSFYLEKFRGKEIPGVFVMVGAANPEKGIPAGSHHAPDFKIDQEVMGDLAALYSAFSAETLRYLKDKKEQSE